MAQDSDNNSDFERFVNTQIEKYFLNLKGQPLIQEQRFKPSMVFCKEIWPLLRYYQWEQFCVSPTRNAIVLIVHEFYASLKEDVIKNRSIYKVCVRGKYVPHCKDVDAIFGH